MNERKIKITIQHKNNRKTVVECDEYILATFTDRLKCENKVIQNASTIYNVTGPNLEIAGTVLNMTHSTDRVYK